MEKKLQPHQLRVIDEYIELRERFLKLQIFLSSKKFEEVKLEQKCFLTQQSKAMTMYLSCLKNRIIAFVSEVYFTNENGEVTASSSIMNEKIKSYIPNLPVFELMTDKDGTPLTLEVVRDKFSKVTTQKYPKLPIIHEQMSQNSNVILASVTKGTSEYLAYHELENKAVEIISDYASIDIIKMAHTPCLLSKIPLALRVLDELNEGELTHHVNAGLQKKIDFIKQYDTQVPDARISFRKAVQNLLLGELSFILNEEERVTTMISIGILTQSNVIIDIKARIETLWQEKELAPTDNSIIHDAYEVIRPFIFNTLIAN